MFLFFLILNFSSGFVSLLGYGLFVTAHDPSGMTKTKPPRLCKFEMALKFNTFWHCSISFIFKFLAGIHWNFTVLEQCWAVINFFSLMYSKFTIPSLELNNFIPSIISSGHHCHFNVSKLRGHQSMNCKEIFLKFL